MQAPPLSIVIVEIVRHTPPWVWAVLVAITALGLWQCRTYDASRRRLLLAPIAFAAYSLWATCSAFGIAAAPAWLAGTALVLLAGRTWRPSPAAEPTADGRIVVAGSPLPLLLMWTLFALRYVVAVMLVFHPGWAHGAAMVVGMAALYGALSAVFAARAWGVLHAARPATTIQRA